MDPAATSPEGAHALVALLRDHGVEVVVADDIDAVERAAQPDTLVITVQTNHLVDDDVLRRLAAVPGDRFVVEPISRTRDVLAPEVRRDAAGTAGGAPDCDMREATTRRGCPVRCERNVRGDRRCARDAVLRRRGCPIHRRGPHRDSGRQSADFMTNSGLLKRGQRRAGDEPGRRQATGHLVRTATQ